MRNWKLWTCITSGLSILEFKWRYFKREFEFNWINVFSSDAWTRRFFCFRKLFCHRTKQVRQRLLGVLSRAHEIVKYINKWSPRLGYKGLENTRVGQKMWQCMCFMSFLWTVVGTVRFYLYGSSTTSPHIPCHNSSTCHIVGLDFVLPVDRIPCLVLWAILEQLFIQISVVFNFMAAKFSVQTGIQMIILPHRIPLNSRLSYLICEIIRHVNLFCH